MVGVPFASVPSSLAVSLDDAIMVVSADSIEDRLQFYSTVTVLWKNDRREVPRFGEAATSEFDEIGPSVETLAASLTRLD
jgi:hypothetical protein